ncbi:GNAT family N-acetyltransferase [Aminobacter sp. HY435]|uniref:GNAT family N-acetyltransferase n=1 Tax=Aminobacter sp. HY435 TaxID=2970917 RepID=UPI002FD5FC12
MRADAAAIAAYRQFGAHSVHGPSQSGDWVSTWADVAGADAIIATLSAEGRPVLALALEVCRKGPFTVARFIGGSHANGNFPASDARWLETASHADVQALLASIKRARPDIDLVAFERLLSDLDGLPNPLLKLPSSPSPNVALAVNLNGGFEAVLGRTSGKKKRKRHRSQQRKYEAVGGHKRVLATNDADIDAMFDAFFAMKKQRFGAMGITDVFGEPQVRRFFRTLFSTALKQPEPAFVLHGLEVGGKYRAVTGSSRVGSRLVCEFGAIADDELAYASPGEFLFFDNIEEACKQGFAVYDFSVGDEPYKRQWCDIEIRHADVLAPLTAKGSAYALALRMASLIKRAIKNNAGLWAVMKRLRTGVRGKAPTPAEED